MCGKASADMSIPLTSGAITSRARRPLHRDHRPLLGDRGQEDIELRPFGLQVVLHVIEDARRAAGRGRDVKAVVRKTRDDAVVHHVAVFPEHQPVAAAAGLELQPVSWDRAVQELGRIRPTTSILPRVVASKMPTLARTALHSRATAACMSSPSCGK